MTPEGQKTAADLSSVDCGTKPAYRPRIGRKLEGSLFRATTETVFQVHQSSSSQHRQHWYFKTDFDLSERDNWLHTRRDIHYCLLHSFVVSIKLSTFLSNSAKEHPSWDIVAAPQLTIESIPARYSLHENLKFWRNDSTFLRLTVAVTSL